VAVYVYVTAPLIDAERVTVAFVFEEEVTLAMVGAEMEVVTELEAVEEEDVAFAPTATTVNV
jgi:hypothetical protein